MILELASTPWFLARNGRLPGAKCFPSPVSVQSYDPNIQVGEPTPKGKKFFTALQRTLKAIGATDLSNNTFSWRKKWRYPFGGAGL